MNAITNDNIDLPTANVIDALPREITNRVTGDRLRIVHSVAAHFASLKIEFTLPPHAKGAPLHYHLNFVETFEVLDGKLEMRVGGANSKQIVRPGKTVIIPKGTLHGFDNPHQESVTFTAEISPASEFEKFIRSMYGLANDGKTNKDGVPTNFLHLALLLNSADFYFPLVLPALQKIVRKALAGFARKIGAEKPLLKYHTAQS